MKNYYEILGVANTADVKEIKAKYRALSKKFHPDVNPGAAAAEENFKEINEAQEHLLDASKRAVHDAQLSDPYARTSGQSARSQAARPQAANQSIGIVIEVTAEETLHSIHKKVSYQRKVSCKTCSGQGGSSPNAYPQRCHHCGGVGGFTQVSVNFGGPFGAQQTQVFVACPSCNGRGVHHTVMCNDCMGQGSKGETVERDVFLGVGVGMTSFEGGGHHEFPSSPPGRLEVQLKVGPHPRFRYNGLNLVARVAINPVLAMLGGEVQVKSLDGMALVIHVPKGAKEGHTEEIPQQGLPIGENRRASLLVELVYKVPESITSEEEGALRQYLKLTQQAQK